MIELEQKILTGVDSDGSEVSNKNILDEFAKLKVGMDESNKLRILFAIVVCLDITEDQFNIIASDIPKEKRRLFTNLKHFGIYFADKKSKKGRRQNKLTKEEFKIFKNSTANFKYKALRSSCMLESIVEKCCEQKLSDYPFLSEPPSSLFASNKKKNINHYMFEEEEKEKNKLVVVLIGGISQNEIVALENLDSKISFKVITCSTKETNAESFMNQISSIRSESDVIFGDENLGLKEKDIRLDFK